MSNENQNQVTKDGGDGKREEDGEQKFKIMNILAGNNEFETRITSWYA